MFLLLTWGDECRIATVFQDPDSQFCMPTVEEEMAFTLGKFTCTTRGNGKTDL